MPMTNQYDVIVVGGGHNGLVCATYLARDGRKVLVLEAENHFGGAAKTREIAPGFKISAGAHLLTMLNPEVRKDMRLDEHGLKFAAKDLKTIALAEDGEHISIHGDAISGGDITAKDQAAMKDFHKTMLRFSKLLASAFRNRPPKLVEGDWHDRINLLKLGLGMRMLGREDMREIMRVGLINVYDVLHERFDSELLKGALSLDGLLGSHMAPRSPNTVLGYLYRRLGDLWGYRGPSLPEGGMGAVGLAMANSAKSMGVELRSNSAVVSINTESGRTTGVTLQGGEVLEAGIVISNADPKNTFQKLVGIRNIETDFSRRVENIRMQGNVAKLHLALDDLPEFVGVSASDIGQRLVIAPDMDYVERAFNPSKYGELCEAPILEIIIPSVHDTSLAPDDKHVLSAVVQYAPYSLKAGWENEKDRFKAIVIDLLEQYSPGIKAKIITSELLSPLDIEREFHMTGGHWHHGEISFDQILMMRGAYGSNQYATPIDGLYLCGAGAHPGGNVMGLAGRNAAKEVMKRGAAA